MQACRMCEPSRHGAYSAYKRRETVPFSFQRFFLCDAGLTNLSRVHCFHVFLPPMMTTPPEMALPDPQKYPSFYGEFHVRYPLRQSLVSIPFGHMVKALSEFRTIVNDLALGFFTDTKDNERAVNTIRHAWPRLSQWYTQLPEELNTRNISFPHELKMQ